MRWLALLSAAVVIAALTGASHASAAGDGVAVAGSYTPTDFGSTSCALVGGSGFILRCDTTGFVTEYTGDLEGSAVADFTQLIDCKTGRAYGHGSETFTGTLTGVGSGTLTYTDQFSSDFDCTSGFPFNLDIDSVAVAGSGGLSGLQGKIHFDDTSYSGNLH